MPKRMFTAEIHREDDLYVALCPQLDVASQGATAEEASANLQKAVQAFVKCASPKEIAQRLGIVRS